MLVHTLVEGERTRLRPACWGFSDEELRRRYRWSMDEVLQYWSGSIPGGRSFNHFRDTVAQRDWPNDGKRISYGILTRAGDLIGMVSCYNIDRSGAAGELGVYLGERELWGQGYGTDAVTTFLRHLFSDLNFRDVYLHTYESNVRAQRSYINTGFELAEKRRRFSARVGFHDEIKMTITRDRFVRLHGLKEPVASR